MYRILLALFLLIPAAAWAQEADETPPATESSESADGDAADAAAEDDELDDPDELYPVEDEEKFIPSENVAFGQSIPFPTDI